jgi:tRNA pseudouridine38-40 synthase
MAHYKLIIAYDGTAYHGFQRQANKASVQLVLETALRQLGWQGRAVLPSGRTDSGVHALGQVISFNLDWKHGDSALRNALNAGLPADISVRRVSQVDPAFHPRYDALSRTYRYAIYRSEARNPLLDRFAWRLNDLPDWERMNQAAAELIGEHDFSAFGKALHAEGTTVRRVDQAEWRLQAPELLTFTISANAFLYHMVRRIVHCLVLIGLEKQPLTLIRQGLESGSSGIVDLAPARGLTLMRVRYSDDINEEESLPGQSLPGSWYFENGESYSG